MTVVVIVTPLSKNNLTPLQQMRYSQGSFSRFSRCFYLESIEKCSPIFHRHCKSYTCTWTVTLNSSKGKICINRSAVRAWWSFWINLARMRWCYPQSSYSISSWGLCPPGSRQELYSRQYPGSSPHNQSSYPWTCSYQPSSGLQQNQVFPR